MDIKMYTYIHAYVGHIYIYMYNQRRSLTLTVVTIGASFGSRGRARTVACIYLDESWLSVTFQCQAPS